MTKVTENNELRQYRKFGLTMLQLMVLLASVGIVLTVLTSYFF